MIRGLRETRGIARRELAEQSGISISHLEKIESGQRSPGMGTFIRIMTERDVNISLHENSPVIYQGVLICLRDARPAVTNFCLFCMAVFRFVAHGVLSGVALASRKRYL